MKRLLPALALWLFTLAAQAHDVMGTVIYVDLGRSRVHLELEIPVDELRLAYGLPTEPGVAELPASPAQVVSYVREHLAVSAPDGEKFALDASAGELTLHDSRNWQHIELDATPPGQASPRDFQIETDLINHRVLSHRIFVFLRHDLATGQLGEPVMLDVLHYQSHFARITRESGSVWVGLNAVFRLGLEHIADGSDHLLFLFTLLLPASLLVSQRRWAGRRGARASALAVLRIVTAFTLGHSVTLLLGSLGLARLPSALVESLIALSVMVSAAHALVPLFPRREAWVALAFGLVHGLGFASALEGLGVDGGTLALTVFGFNLGVEVMQALLVLVTLPWVFLLQGTRLGAPFRQLGGALSFLVALGWLGERALDIEPPLLDAVDSLFSHGPWLLATLAVVAVLAHGFEYRVHARRATSPLLRR